MSLWPCGRLLNTLSTAASQTTYVWRANLFGTLLGSILENNVCVGRCPFSCSLFAFFVAEQRIRSNADYRNALQENENNLVVIKFFAPWCRSCKAMDVKYRRLAAQNKNVKFFEVRVSDPLGGLAFRGCWEQRGEIPLQIVLLCRELATRVDMGLREHAYFCCTVLL